MSRAPLYRPHAACGASVPVNQVKGRGDKRAYYGKCPACEKEVYLGTDKVDAVGEIANAWQVSDVEARLWLWLNLLPFVRPENSAERAPT